MKCTEPVPRPGESSQTLPRRTLARRWLHPRVPTFDGPYTTLELIKKTIGGNAPPKIN